jgi:hypothetical protein
MEDDDFGIWYDFEKKEYVNIGEPKTDEEALPLLPNEVARRLYSLYRKQGKSVLDSMIEVLERIVD